MRGKLISDARQLRELETRRQSPVCPVSAPLTSHRLSDSIRLRKQAPAGTVVLPAEVVVVVNGISSESPPT